MTQTKQNTVGVLYIRSIPNAVKKRFKAWCAENGVSMTKKIEQLMRQTYDSPDEVFNRALRARR